MSETTLSHRIAERIRTLRARNGLTLEALADRSNVSRSMISSIERAESSPTAVTLERLAAGLGVPLASLFDAPDTPDPVARRQNQPVWQDPESAYLRRNIAPPVSPIRLVEVEFPPGGRVAYDTAARDPVQHQLVWVLEGNIEVTVGATTHHLAQGDCLAFVLDQPTTYRNTTKRPARYAVVIAH